VARKAKVAPGVSRNSLSEYTERMLDSWLRDIFHGFRFLRKNPILYTV